MINMDGPDIPASEAGADVVTPGGFDRRMVVLVTLAAVAGLAGGIVTDFLQQHLHGGWSVLTDSVAPWLSVAFAAGALLPSRHWAGAFAGLASQAGLVAGYFVTAALRHVAADAGIIMFWLGAGALGGPVYGAAGAGWRGQRLAWRTAGAALFGGVWLLDGAYYVQLAARPGAGPGVTAGWCEITAGVVLAFALGRSWRGRLLSVIGLIPVVLLGAGVYALANNAIP